MDCSPNSLTKDGPVSICHNNVKDLKHPGNDGAVLSQSYSSGGKFSFGKGHLNKAGKNSPNSYLRHHQHSGGGGGTPSLFVAAKKTCSNNSTQFLQGCDAVASNIRDDDTSLPRDSNSTEEPEFLDLDLLRSKDVSPDSCRKTVMSLTALQRQQVQRLLCSTGALMMGKEALDVLSSLPALNFLILSLDSCSGNQQQSEGALQEHDLWPGLRDLMGVLKHVVCLDVSKCLMKDHNLEAVSQTCNQLRALDLSYTPHVSDKALTALLQSCPNLEELDISSCPAATTDTLLKAVGENCKNLSTLYIEFDPQVASTPLGTSVEVSAERVVEMLQSCPQLQVLSLAGLPIMCHLKVSAPCQPSKSVTGDCVTLLDALVLASPQLTTLDVSGCPWPRLSHFNQLSQAWPSLRSLSLSNRELAAVKTDESIDRNKEMPSAINFITDQFVSGVGRSLVDLTVLECPAALSEDAIIRVVKDFPELSAMSLVGTASEAAVKDVPSLMQRLQHLRPTLKMVFQDPKEHTSMEIHHTAEDQQDPPSSHQTADRDVHHCHLSQPLRVADPIQPSCLMNSMHVRASSMDVDKSPMRDDVASVVEDPMSVSRPSPPLIKPGFNMCSKGRQCDVNDGFMGTQQASSAGWGGLMSFLTDHVVDVSMASCKKASKPQAEARG
ncbi:hypothetical protein CEUSTIGMA_g7100.t1 [Chlamydomonas eustigma]|uniref:F-box domain-containing protein n=1 Tax=Chlamydomonas eustigma TaxID=1157962 RepID=A0A250X9T9_9CHLO|nr:hypothetical protein CEUSTIGMA_g7100.t1 [Chlamydomonas eustigma]|eukprot:GAX79659.1 hypothetical protein CEUSTIGMA_g7100.t1 [Chlamydomonas eustigma]